MRENFETSEDAVLRMLETAMLVMPRKRREIFLAKRLDNLSYAEIAWRTGLTTRQVERQMAKAVATIDRHLSTGQPISGEWPPCGILAWIKKFAEGK